MYNGPIFKGHIASISAKTLIQKITKVGSNIQGANFYICKDKKKFKDTLTRFGFYTMTMCKQQNIIINTINTYECNRITD